MLAGASEAEGWLATQEKWDKAAAATVWGNQKSHQQHENKTATHC